MSLAGAPPRRAHGEFYPGGRGADRKMWGGGRWVRFAPVGGGFTAETQGTQRRAGGCDRGGGFVWKFDTLAGEGVGSFCTLGGDGARWRGLARLGIVWRALAQRACLPSPLGWDGE
jgi:hypothetical protein